MLEALFVNSLLAQGADFLRVMERTADFYTFALSDWFKPAPYREQKAKSLGSVLSSR